MDVGFICKTDFSGFSSFIADKKKKNSLSSFEIATFIWLIVVSTVMLLGDALNRISATARISAADT